MAGGPSASPPQRVQLFRTCLVNDFLPEAGIAAVGLLERAGCEVEVPRGQTCCGQPAWNAGFREEARAVARHALAGLARTEGPVVIPSGSCADMLVHQTAELFRGDAEWSATARAVAARCVELTAFLAGRVASPPSGTAKPAASRVKTAYHPSCHLLRGLGVREEPLRLLAAVPSLEQVPLAAPEECCGFGGAFSVGQPDLSGAMLERKCAAIEASGADVVASCDAGCVLHLAGGLRRRGSRVRVVHVAQLLDGGAA